MLISDCQTNLDRIVADLGSRFVVERQTQAIARTECMVRTPFLYPDNSPIVVYLDQIGADFVVSDHGEAGDYAFIHGVAPGTITNRLKKTGDRLGLTVDQGEILYQTPIDSAGDAIAILVSAILDVGTLTYQRSRRQQKRDFHQEVEAFFVHSRWPYSKNVEIVSKSNRHRKIDYRIDPAGFKQLNIWTFDPTVKGSGRRADEIAISYLDLIGVNQDDTNSFLVLLGPSTGNSQDEGFSSAITLLKDRGPRLVDWDERHVVEELLMAA